MTITAEGALAALRAAADPERAGEMARYHKVARDYLGLSNKICDDLARAWRAELTLDERLALASTLWDTDIYEARITAAKLLTQARIRPEDDGAWNLIKSWVPQFDSWAIADAVAMAGQRRLSANPARLDEVETWTRSDHMWTRRAALVFTLPWCKQRHPKPEDLVARERILGWAATYCDDPQWFIQKAVAWWLRDLSKRDPERVRAFLAEFGERMKPFARKEAGRLLPTDDTAH